ncbi:hypothetical protein A0U92_03425 [Acetobacter aceti]|uniref:Uncharacterized protein n=1 Tax=Acetobacter aceti TaxID=435 RepID=A0A1U9KDT6_ACEAC|nr:hypothetical protein [Acetobacter aceti]AQS83971.1 hypothetical protein A0U92_03425 [Acetobacter aceti]
MARTREEQLTQFKIVIRGLLADPVPSAKAAVGCVAKAFIEEAEQRGYERARAECAELCSGIGQTYRELSASGEIEATRKMHIGAFRCAQAIGDGETPRSAIDAAMKGDGE